MVSEKHGKRVRGLHQPLISEELFDEVQRFLNGEKPASAPKKKLNPALPLKNFIRCGACGTKLTGGFVTKKNGSRYGYYWCRKAGCRAVKSISSVLMECDFKQLLKRLRPTEDTLASFPKIAAKLWAETQGNVEKQRNRLTAELNEAKTQKAALLKMRLNGELSREEFEEANADYLRKVDSLTQELHTLESVSARQEAFIRFVEVRLMDISGAWEKAEAENRYRVQTLLFSEGLTYDPTSNSLNSENSTLFNNLTEVGVSCYQDGVPDGI
jgi:site-specific DNA recombinase